MIKKWFRKINFDLMINNKFFNSWFGSGVDREFG